MVRFDKPCVLAHGAVEYFREHMAVGDYLTQEGQAEMTWVGTGAGKVERPATFMQGVAGRLFPDRPDPNKNCWLAPIFSPSPQESPDKVLRLLCS